MDNVNIAPLSVGSQGMYPYVTNKVTHCVTQAVDYRLNPMAGVTLAIFYRVKRVGWNERLP